jgi:hypothetical protein
MMFFLGKGFGVIAHDRRGHGRSSHVGGGHDMDHYADDVAALTAHLDFKQAVHVGHSTGGGEVVHYIARHDPKKITVPVLVMHGDDDQIVPYADSARAAQPFSFIFHSRSYVAPADTPLPVSVAVHGRASCTADRVTLGRPRLGHRMQKQQRPPSRQGGGLTVGSKRKRSGRFFVLAVVRHGAVAGAIGLPRFRRLIAEVEIRGFGIAHWPHAGPARRAGDQGTPRRLRLGLDLPGRRRPSRQPQAVGLADDGIAGHAAAQLLGDLAGGLALEPELLQNTDPFLSPSRRHRFTPSWFVYFVSRKYEPTIYSFASVNPTTETSQGEILVD